MDAADGRVRVLLFDVDGTLVRVGGAGRRGLNRAAYNLYGKPNVFGEHALAGHTDLWNFREAVRRAAGRKPSRREVERLYREYLRLLPGYVRRAWDAGKYRVVPGVKRLLRRLSRENALLLGLGTGNLEQGARIKLEPSGLNAYFPFGGFGSDAFHRPALLRKAVARARRRSGAARVAKGDVFVIGDTPLDVKAGKKAGFVTIGVGTGFARWEDLAASEPDHLAKDFRNLKEWLGWFGLSRKG
ncbi:MAG: HAD hydrolase-like protein [Elusimicrobia bacterium]|nr:HAD hydrolase-like protein [Elusimicrobiota bacterium]